MEYARRCLARPETNDGVDQAVPEPGQGRPAAGCV